MTLAVAILGLALAPIASEHLHRAKVVLLVAALVVATQTIEPEQAIEAIDFNTIGLLAGIMLMVKPTETTGVHTWACDPCPSALARRAAGRRDRARRLGERFLEHQ
jgi:Na+/H+ antiporter NhaD/arsenite permease-like protein